MKFLIIFAALAICYVSSVHGDVTQDHDTDTTKPIPIPLPIPSRTLPYRVQKDVIGEIVTALNQNKEYLNSWINEHGEHIRQTLFMMQYQRFNWVAYVNNYMRVVANWLDN